MPEHKTPGVYIEEISRFPTSIESVETAIPAFIGYTEKARYMEENDLRNKPQRIKSLLEYEQFFGFPDPEKESLSVAFTTSGAGVKIIGKLDEAKRSKFLMYYSLQMFFDNGGGPCWITSVGDYQSTGGGIVEQDLLGGLAEVAKVDEVTLLVFPDAINLANADEYYDVHRAAIEQCVLLRDRFVVLDVYHSEDNGGRWQADIQLLRDTLSGTTNDLKYAAVYFPRILTGVNFNYKVPGDQSQDNDESVTVTGGAAGTLAELKTINNAWYFQAKSAINDIPMLLPASSAMVGIYAQVDGSRGVWKAPANININNVIQPQFLITRLQQEELNVDTKTGKSINVIRKFEGRGPAIVWGARTLAGNDNEWRYISVRRFFNMVEESVKKATGQFVFEPNDSNTRTRVKSMIDNYLTRQWMAGALMGSRTVEAFFVKVGLGETMTVLDIEEGRMIVEIGMAVVRPVEFTILRFMHKMFEKS
ncbi:MAG: phage tail sheath family protein [Chitinophagaceae bacterium]|nr:phage tail sheath family protein [Chitinophagaceae bacterium]